MPRTGDIRAELLALAKRVRRDASITSEEAQGSGARERATEEAGGDQALDKSILEEALRGNY